MFKNNNTNEKSMKHGLFLIYNLSVLHIFNKTSGWKKIKINYGNLEMYEERRARTNR